jgi:hypothetical protein
MTPIPFQVTVDSANPHRQARFWAAALGYDLEDHHDFVKRLLDDGAVTADDVIEIDGRYAWRTGAAIRHPDDPPAGTPDAVKARRLLFMLVPEAKVVKNRWHLDLNVGRDRIEAEVARLEGLGATALYRIDEPGAFHTTMADPEGNEFCVQ